MWELMCNWKAKRAQQSEVHRHLRNYDPNCLASGWREDHSAGGKSTGQNG
jgi:hypothetical protein